MKKIFKNLIKSGGRQTPAEKELIKAVSQELKKKTGIIIINIGAGKSQVIEEALITKGINFKLDRLDIRESEIDAPYFRKSYKCSIENCPELINNSYDLAFANYVFEHLEHLSLAIKEVARILKPNSIFVLSIPNPQALEFKIAQKTPLAFHQTIRGEKIDETHEAFTTFYSYKSIKELINIFYKNSFSLKKSYYRSFLYGYLYRFPVLSILARLYDYLVNIFKIKSLSGQVCLVFEKKEK
ncbi:MAG: methyltransferase domain-containing protein [Patescibacteria group bacterium]|jgi:ubiquinone/menaquinone biosynthesis C-methylase UbiE